MADEGELMQQTAAGRCQQAAEQIHSSRSGLCLHAVSASVLLFGLIPVLGSSTATDG